MGASFAQAMLESEKLNHLTTPSINETSTSSDPGSDSQIDNTLIEQGLKPYEKRMYLSDFDHQVAYHRVRTLKQGFPFVLSNNTQPYQQGYKPTGPADSLGFLAVHASKRWDEAKVELGGCMNATTARKSIPRIHGAY